MVLDRDDWSINTLRELSKKCDKQGYNFTLSNPCFELWLLLHQEKSKLPSSCRDCGRELKKLLPNYKKSNFDSAKLIVDVNHAIRRALILNKNGKNIQEPPYTAAYKLVEKLLIKDL